MQPRHEKTLAVQGWSFASALKMKKRTRALRISLFELHNRGLKGSLVDGAEIGHRREHLVDHTHVRCQVVVHQVGNQVAADETTSSKDQNSGLVGRHGSARETKHKSQSSQAHLVAGGVLWVNFAYI